jgi:hypothetical protein
MKTSTVRGVWLGFGVLLVVFAAVNFYTVRSIDASRESLRESLKATGETGRAAGAAVSEMKSNVNRIGDGTLAYTATADSREPLDPAVQGGGPDG